MKRASEDSAGPNAADGLQPGRYWWLKRLSVLAVLCLAALIGVRIWWGTVAENRLQAEIARIKAAGEPLFIKDFQRPPLADEDNAATYYLEALAVWPRIAGQLVTDSKWYIQPETYPDPVADDSAYLLSLNPVLQLLDRAAEARDVQWNASLTSPVVSNLPYTHLSPTRQLVRLLDDAAQRAVNEGDHRLAMELIEHMFAVADALIETPQSALDLLVALAIKGLVLHRVERNLSSLQIGEAPNMATAAQISRLVDRLLATERRRARYAASIIAERAVAFDTANAVQSGLISLEQLNPWGTSHPLHEWYTKPIWSPLFELDTAWMLRYMGSLTASMTTSQTIGEYQKAMAPARGLIGGELERDAFLHPITSLYGGYDSLPAQFFRVETQYRIVAVALAIKLYQREFGRRPKTLDELVPRFLSQLPRDPMASDGRGLVYNPVGVDPLLPWADAMDEAWGNPINHLGRKVAILYSVGENGVDDGGVFRVYDGMPSNGDAESKDFVHVLDGPLMDVPVLDPEPLNLYWLDESLGETFDDDPEPEDSAGDDTKDHECE